MTAWVIETAILLLIAFLIGCVIGYLLRKWFGGSKSEQETSAGQLSSVAGSDANTKAPYEWSATKDGADIILSGHVPSAASRSLLVDTAEKLTSGSVTDETVVMEDAPSDHLDLAKTGLDVLNGLSRGKAVLVDGKLTVTGDAETPAGYEAAVKLLDQAGATYTIAPAEEVSSGSEQLEVKPSVEEDEAAKTAEATTEEAQADDLVDIQIPEDRAEAAEKADGLGDRPKVLAAARGGDKDDLKRVKGIGPQNENRLNGLGIFHFDQIAAWSEREALWVGSYLAFPGRIEREGWIAQAKKLADGEETEFSKRVDKGEVPSSKK